MAKMIDMYSLQELQGVDIYGCTYDVSQLTFIRHVTQNQGSSTQSATSVWRSTTQLPFLRKPSRMKVSTYCDSVAIHKKICHGNLINFVKMFKTANNYYLVYEFFNGGTLYEKITSSKLTESQENLYIRQLILAVRELHDCKIAHLNLNPHLIYIVAGGMVKIANFAHSREILKYPATDYDITKFKHVQLLAPQQLSSSPVTLKTDIYSLGRVISFIKYGRMETPESIFTQQIKQNQPFVQFLSSMLQKDPAKRNDIDPIKQNFLNISNRKVGQSPSYTSMRDVVDRKSEEDKSPLPKKQQMNRQINKSKESMSNASKTTLETTSNTLSGRTKTSQDVEVLSERKSFADSQEDGKADTQETKSLLRQRSRYNFLLMVAQQVCLLDLSPNTLKLSFLLAKKSNHLAQKSLEKATKTKPKKYTQQLTKMLEQQSMDVRKFYDSLRDLYVRNQKSLMTDSAFELQIEDDSLNLIYLRKQCKEYISTVLPKVDLSRRDDDGSIRRSLRHLNNVADALQLDRFFTDYMNDSVVNLSNQVYFSEVDKMQMKDLQRFISQKIV